MGPALILRAPKVPEKVFEADFTTLQKTFPNLQVCNVTCKAECTTAIKEMLKQAEGAESALLLVGHGTSDYSWQKHADTGFKSKEPVYFCLDKEYFGTDDIKDLLTFVPTGEQPTGLMRIFSNMCYGYAWTAGIESINKQKASTKMGIELYTTTNVGWVEDDIRKWGNSSWFSAAGSRNVLKDKWSACNGPLSSEE